MSGCMLGPLISGNYGFKGFSSLKHQSRISVTRVPGDLCSTQLGVAEPPMEFKIISSSWLSHIMESSPKPQALECKLTGIKQQKTTGLPMTGLSAKLQRPSPP